jgi:methanogenic corrinoid protein MtbC1
MPVTSSNTDRSKTLRAPRADAGKLTIGALSRATGIPIETLRTWEARYGFPIPERRPSGHRLYPTQFVPRLRRIAEAIARGHRAGQVVPASDEALTSLLGAIPAPSGASGSARTDAGVLPQLFSAIDALDGPTLTHLLQSEYTRLGPLTFTTHVVAPLLQSVGDAWKRGRLDIRHEHFCSERLADLLRSLRLPFEARAAGPLVVLATLPGERHSLGLQMAALVLSVAGCRIVSLGTDLPVAQIADVAAGQGARAVAVSVSTAARRTATGKQLVKLRSLLPRHIAVVVGGEGSPAPGRGIEVMRDLAALDAWARRIAIA